MKRIELINGNLYFGDYTIVNHFVKIFPKQAFVYTKEAGGYLEIKDVPVELLVPVWRIESLMDLPKPQEEQQEEPTAEEAIPESA